jgi:hypothetical protein
VVYGLLAGLAGSLLAVFWHERAGLAIAELLSLLGAWAMIATTEFSWSWAHWLSPSAPSQNLIGNLPPQGAVERRVVLCAHLDTHRTPVFYSSPRWHRIFSRLVTGIFLSLALGGLIFGLGALFTWPAVGWFGLLSGAMQAFGLAMLIPADSTPFSPGANDNASGVGVITGLLERLAGEPLQHTEVICLLTGCEETGAVGVRAYLDAHAAELGRKTLFIILDEVGTGNLKYLSSDGILYKTSTHPQALALARQARTDLPFEVGERVGLAYTDALPVTRRGLPAITISVDADPAQGQVSHWHQMSDRIETLDPVTLEKAHEFAWKIIQIIDGDSTF